MKHNIKYIMKKFLYQVRATSSSYIQYLRKKGVQIGEDCIIYSPRNCFIDTQYPWMITIGNHVRLTHGVIILTHDFSWSVLKKLPTKLQGNVPGAIFGSSGNVNIGNNVFIGMNTIITKGVSIGDNVIIGAGSVVTKDCAANGVYGGNPAHFIMRITEFYEKRKNKQLEEARNLARCYQKRYGKNPPKEIFNEYFMLFDSFDSASENANFKMQIELCNNGQDTKKYMEQNCRRFSTYDEFLSFCLNNEE